METTTEAPLEVSQFQQALLEDGVTPEEYQIAVDAWLSCLAEQGMIATSKPTPENPLDGFDFTFDPNGPIMSIPKDEKEVRQSAIDWTMYNCNKEYFREVQFQYVSSKTLTGDAHAAGMKALVECLEKRLDVTGLSVSDSEKALRTKIDAQIPLEEQWESSACFEKQPYLFPPPGRWLAHPPLSEEWIPPQR